MALRADSATVSSLLARGTHVSRSDALHADAIIHRRGFSTPHPLVHALAIDALLDSVSALVRVDARLSDAADLLQNRIAGPLSTSQETRRRVLRDRVAAAAREADRTRAAAEARAAREAERSELALKWDYSVDKDPMTSRTSRSAAILSENTVSFGFPYDGEQHGTLVVRSHPSYGHDVYLQLQRGQFQCPSYLGCRVRIRFDEGAPEYWSGAGPDDSSSETIFIRGYDRFVRKLRAAKTVRIQANVFQEGAPTFEFQVGGFDYGRYSSGS